MLLQGQAVSHGTIVERLKTESARLRQQLVETQQRAIKDKALLARHLEGIQSDMMEREAAFLEIQRERKLYEDTFNYQVFFYWLYPITLFFFLLGTVWSSGRTRTC